MSKFTLELNEYQAVNLLHVLREIKEPGEFSGLNTGDWCGEIVFELEDIENNCELTREPNEIVLRNLPVK